MLPGFSGYFSTRSMSKLPTRCFYPTPPTSPPDFMPAFLHNFRRIGGPLPALRCAVRSNKRLIVSWLHYLLLLVLWCPARFSTGNPSQLPFVAGLSSRFLCYRMQNNSRQSTLLICFGWFYHMSTSSRGVWYDDKERR